MYFENCDTVLPMKKQTIVVSRKEMSMSGPALSAMIGNVNTMLSDGAMCVMPWNTTSGRPSAPRWRWGAAVGLASMVTGGTSLGGTGEPTAAPAPHRAGGDGSGVAGRRPECTQPV